jgi:polar amino acid transport system permease protein
MASGFGVAELGFLLDGLGWTLLLASVALLSGGICALPVALARSSTSRWVLRPAAAYIWVFQGTPLLMQLFVAYYGLGLIGVKLPAWAAVAVGFTLNASAFLGDIWRGAIQAIPRGQTEAARALGLHFSARMRKVILPQAFRIAQPATVGYLVQLIKGTSLAAILSFIELTRAGQIVANQIFRPLLVYAVVGGLYFVICWPLSLASARLEARLAVAKS